VARLAAILWLTGNAARATKLADKVAVLAVPLGPVASAIEAGLEIVEVLVAAAGWVIAVVQVAAGLVIAGASRIVAALAPAIASATAASVVVRQIGASLVATVGMVLGVVSAADRRA
jgi:hypothetical protein